MNTHRSHHAASASAAAPMICTTLLVLSSFMVSRSSSKPMVCVSTSSWPTMCDSVDASASGVAESGAAGVGD